MIIAIQSPGSNYWRNHRHVILIEDNVPDEKNDTETIPQNKTRACNRKMMRKMQYQQKWYQQPQKKKYRWRMGLSELKPFCLNFQTKMLSLGQKVDIFPDYQIITSLNGRCSSSML